MSVKIHVNVGVAMVAKENGTYAVQKRSNSVTYGPDGSVLNETPWTVRKEWEFQNEAAAIEFFGELRMKLDQTE